MKFNKINIPKNKTSFMKKKIIDCIKIDEDTDCWILTKYFHHNGKKFAYCKMSINVDGVRSSYFVHRLSYHLFNGKIPEKALILHKCNNYKCVNPDHLYAGDQKQNMLDCKISGNEKKSHGEDHYKSILKDEDIKKIFILKDMGFSINQIGRLYKVAPITIRNVLKEKTWKHI